MIGILSTFECIVDGLFTRLEILIQTIENNCDDKTLLVELETHQ